MALAKTVPPAKPHLVVDRDRILNEQEGLFAVGARVSNATLLKDSMRFSILRSPADILRLSHAARELARQFVAQDDLTVLPEYFLCRMKPGMRGRVVACYEGQALVGVIYAEEWQIFGVPTGWAFGGDDMGRGFVLCKPGREAEIISKACRHLLENGIHALRVRWCPFAEAGASLPLIDAPGLQAVNHVDYRPEGDWLDLPDQYEAFLARLGNHTRRNLRYYRRKAESEGIQFDPNMRRSEYDDAVVYLKDLADFPHVREREYRDKQFFSIISEPLLIGLKRSNGQFVSILSAVQFGKNLHVLSQLNDRSLRRMSISLVLRSYLLEEAIRRGCTSIHFVNGSSPMLGRYCAPVLVRTISADRRKSLVDPFKIGAGRFARAREQKAHRVSTRLLTLLGNNFSGRLTLKAPAEMQTTGDAEALDG